MHFTLEFSEEAAAQLEHLRLDPALEKRREAVEETLGLMQTNLLHRSLQTHKMQSHKGPSGEQVWVAYAENRTPSAYRIYWYYDTTGRGTINVVTICPHP